MTFDEWMNEIENYGTREERMWEDLNLVIKEGGVPYGRLYTWLRAAYDVGYDQGCYEATNSSSCL